MHMPRRRRILIPAIILVFVIAVVLLAVSKRLLQAPATPPALQNASAPYTYTNAITGEQMEDKLNAEVNSGTPQATPVVTHAPITIFGIDHIYDHLTNAQATSLQATLINFLLAHAGLNATTAGIKDSQIIEQGSQTISFTLVLTRPQITYTVTAYVANSFQVNPTVTITPAPDVAL